MVSGHREKRQHSNPFSEASRILQNNDIFGKVATGKMDPGSFKCFEVNAIVCHFCLDCSLVGVNKFLKTHVQFLPLPAVWNTPTFLCFKLECEANRTTSVSL